MIQLLRIRRASSVYRERLLMKRQYSRMKRALVDRSGISSRRGSTLVIVIALLGLLATTGTVFYIFASQQRAAAEFFSEAAKATISEPEDPFEWPLEQIIIGAKNSQKGSVLWSPTRRFSLVRNMVGSDVAPHTGGGINLAYDQTTGLPVTDLNHDGVDDLPTNPLNNQVNLVDALSAWGGASFPPPFTSLNPHVEADLNATRGSGLMPEPDVDYTYPDNNNVFLGYKGWAVRDNGGPPVRFERLRMMIPSFFRPQYMKSAIDQGANGVDVPTDPDWYQDKIHPEYALRSFRPHALHVAGFDSAGNPVLRYLDGGDGTPLNPANPAHVSAISGLPAASGAFPLRPNEGTARFRNSANFGKLGVWTGDGAVSATTFELDSDNDGDGIREGIWIDTQYPIQETASGDQYAVLHSFTIYDLDGLIDLNTSGNIAALPRSGPDIKAFAGPANLLATVPLSQSNQGLGPHEISPLFALAPKSATVIGPPATDPFVDWYNAIPSNRLEQANMEWLWLLTGRIHKPNDPDAVVHDGRLGDASLLWHHKKVANQSVATLPRPGRSGKANTASTDVLLNFGGNLGYDDNLDSAEGLIAATNGNVRGMVHPLDFAGRGRRTLLTDPRVPNLFPTTPVTPERWPQYTDYPLTGDASYYFDNSSYLGGRDSNIATPADNLIEAVNFTPLTTVPTPSNDYNNPLFEDPYETIMDQDRALRPDDQLFGIQDLVSAHLTKTDKDTAKGLSDRLKSLAPEAFADNSDRSQMFTTLSNSFRHYAIAHDLTTRPWEWTADADNDNNLEFPPRFGANAPFAASDPFRPQVRRLLMVEANEQRQLLGQLPISVNHILDIDRTEVNPVDGTPEFFNRMQRAGLQFRPLTEHPVGTETDAGTLARDSVTVVPTVVSGTPLPPFPPRNFADREFWARRDRQKLARDIYVLLYTIGGAEFTAGQVIDYTGNNSARTLYSEDKLRQMAQFAVNLVDAMDTDNVVTKFEYDKNLGTNSTDTNDPLGGWGLDDDPYTFAGPSDIAVLSSNSVPTGVGLPGLTNFGMYPDDQGDRGVVYGVEAQQLAISEVLAFRSRKLAINHPATPYDDRRPGDPEAENDFLFVELQNVLPAPLQLGAQLTSGESESNAVWRLVREDRVTVTDDIQRQTETTPVVPPDHFVAFATDPENIISGGGRFTLSATNAVNASGNVFSSDFYVDIGAFTSTPAPGAYTGASDGTYELIAPNSVTGTMPTTSTPGTDPAWSPRCDLDLIAHDPSAVPTPPFSSTVRFFPSGISFISGIAGTTSTPVAYAGHQAGSPLDGSATNLEGSFAATGTEGSLVPVSLLGGGNAAFDLVLQRRLNPELPKIDETSNPWVEVDRARVALSDFDIDAADTADELRGDMGTTRLKNVLSWERAEPLRDARTVHPLLVDTVNAFRSNSLKGDIDPANNDALGVNASSPAAFEVWQPHWDRQFASTGELLTLPVYPPALITQKLNFSRQSPFQQVGTASPFDACGAAALFLRPDLDPGTPNAAAIDNRWYRLFQFVEVPSRVNRMLGNYINLKRLPGKLNPNTIRDREVYAGLIDEPEFMAQNPLVDSNGNGDEDGPFSDSVAVDGADGIDSANGRDRWLELINERDGNVIGLFDPTPASPGSGDEVPRPYWIPGTPNSRPFHSLGYRRPVDLVAPTNEPENDDGMDETLLRRLGLDIPQDATNGRRNFTGEGNADFNGTPAVKSNRHWLEIGDQTYHDSNSPLTLPPPALPIGTPTAQASEHHQLLSKIINNTTTTSNTFIIFGTAAYFAAHEDAGTGLFQIGGRMGLDLDGDADHTNDAGWEQRAVFVVDRTEFFNAFDSASGTVDWKRLIKYRIDLTSDGK
jgi:hypothetical protein